MEIVLALWVISAVVCAVVAVKKGRNGVGWFFVGLLLGVFGVAWIALISSKAEEAALASGRMKACGRCAEQIRAEAKVCRFCGQEQGAARPGGAGGRDG